MTSVQYGSKRNDTTALVFVADNTENDWGWWCPPCSDNADRTIQQTGFETKAYAVKSRATAREECSQ